MATNYRRFYRLYSGRHSILPRVSALLFLLLSGCASTTNLQLHTNRLSEANQYSPVLLSARASESRLREQWESVCQQYFVDHGFQAQSAHQLSPGTADEEQLLQLAVQNNMPLVISVDMQRWIAEQIQPVQADLMDRERVQFSQPAVEIQLGKGKAPSHEEQSGQNFTLEIYSASEKKILVVALLVTHEANDLERIAASQCDAIVDLLQSEQLNKDQNGTSTRIQNY